MDWAAERSWLIGKKTYLLAGVLLLATLALLFTGHLSPTTALTLLLFAAAGFPATFRAALEHHQKEELALLVQIAATGVAVSGRNIPAALKLGELAAEESLALARELQQETAGEPARP